MFPGRCYIPSDYVNEDDLKCLIDKNPHLIRNAQLKRYADKLLDIGDNLANEAIGAINLLPDECRRAFLMVFENFQGWRKVIRRNLHYERRAYVSNVDKARILLKCMYFTSLASLNERSKRIL